MRIIHVDETVRKISLGMKLGLLLGILTIFSTKKVNRLTFRNFECLIGDKQVVGYPIFLFSICQESYSATS
jgi:hypothetical protein